jgi:hypothetical protein
MHLILEPLYRSNRSLTAGCLNGFVVSLSKSSRILEYNKYVSVLI